MGTTTVFPDATIKSPGMVVSGAGSVHAALADALDTTFITDTAVGTSEGHIAEVSFPDVVLPSGAVIKKVTPKVRAAQVAGSQRIYFTSFVRKPGSTSDFIFRSPAQYVRPPVTPSITTFTGAASGSYMSTPDPVHPEWTPQYVANNLRVFFGASGDVAPLGTGDERFYQVSLVIEYDEQPVASGLGFVPTDAATRTSRPVLEWDFDDPEGSAQAGRRVVVWNATDASDAKCPKAAATTFIATNGTLRTALAWSGIATDPSEMTSSQQWQPSVDLPNASYTVFVQTADYVGTVARWANSVGVGQLNFTIAVDLPVTPTLVAPTWDAVNDRMNLSVSTKNNELSSDAYDNELDDPTSWVANFNASGGVTTVLNPPLPFNGLRSRRWISGGVAGTDSSIITGAFYPCLAGTVKSYRTRVRSGAATRNFNLQVQHFDANGTPVGAATISSNVGGISGGWTLLSLLNVTVPAGATQYKVIVNAVAAGAAESNYIEATGAYPGSTISADTRGGLVPSQRVVIERSVDGGTIWQVIPQCSGTDGGILMDGSTGQQLVTFDLANRHNIAARYRVRTFHDDGTFQYSSANTAASSAVTPTMDSWSVRNPLVETAALVGVQVAGDLQGERIEEMAVYELQGFALPGVVSSGVVGALHWPQVQLVLRSQAAYDTFTQMREDTTVLIMQTDMDGIAYWVRLGPTVPEVLPISSSRRVATTRPRFLTVELFQSAGPPGQPQAGPP